ncbi:hypothetical protein ACVLD2_001348 [Paenibacillus sp. PvR052]|nr:hypothetical protein [Paenibacillus sp. PvP091]MBP1169872.1 hypothetical protein [Paenibacillus sp. PvR098]MBP2440900.1 hypothetical protein [Paenibacillus sp. PvP052]
MIYLNTVYSRNDTLAVRENQGEENNKAPGSGVVSSVTRFSVVPEKVRLYPLVTLGWERYPFLERLLKQLDGETEMMRMKPRLPFIPESNQLLVVEKWH